MKQYVLAAHASLALLVTTSFADPLRANVDDVRKSCRDAFLARDNASYLEAAATMMSLEIVEDREYAQEVALCLALSDLLEDIDIEDIRARAASLDEAVDGLESMPPSSPEEAKLAEYLARAQEEGNDMASVAADIAADSDFAPSAGEDRDRLEGLLGDYVAPIPASRAQANLIAYQALARVNPSEERYRERIQRYESAIEAEQQRLERAARQLEGRLVRTVAEFDGSSWARHPSSPRYQDIRDYITLYLIESPTGHQSLELFVNYTSRNSWLFIQSASVNIDGQTIRLPVSRWFRDNDTEIWEYGGIRGPNALRIARQIAESDRVVIRFNGQQFYSDYVVSETDRRVIREMLAMWDVISAE